MPTSAGMFLQGLVEAYSVVLRQQRFLLNHLWILHPKYFALSQNYPNPFNPSTIISYSISKSDFVMLKIYDILGREIQTLVNEF